MAKKTSSGKSKKLNSKTESISKNSGSSTSSSSTGSPSENVFSMDYDSIGEYHIGKGPERPYLSVDVPESLSALRKPTTSKELIALAVFILIMAYIRFYKLSYPDSVVFDEVHFGKFAAKYITGTYFFDVHPPLAKMLFAGVGSMFGFKGNFLFENIGDFFPNDVPYYAMRFFSAACGLLTCCFMYLTLRSSGVKPWICALSTFLFVIENSFLTISRYILLDAPLILFIAGSAFFYKKYETYPENSFKSLKHLILTGIFLGLSLSSKWVGLFTIAWVGILCLIKLWFYVGDLNTPLIKTTSIASKWGAILLGAPLVCYLLSFNLHFNTLVNDSEGTALLSPAYRASLNGNNVPENIIAPVGFGSVISIRHVNTHGGYLHSHNLQYEDGSKQQQITLYPHIDSNNDWLVEEYNNTLVEKYETFEGLKDGTKIRLKHINTMKRLHSHDHKPPVSSHSDWQKEVSGYGFENFEGDANDDFVVEIDQKLSKKGDACEIVKAIDTKFRLRHAMSGCLLFSHNVNLPDGGQQEVTCAQSGIPELTLWYIELNTHPLLENDTQVERVNYPVFGYWDKFLESNKKMWSVNNGFTDSHVYQSDPTTWPFLTRGIAYWGKDNRFVYLLGNAVVWWLSTATLAIFGGIVSFELIKWQLGYDLNMDNSVINFHIQITHYLLGWFIHYLPFFIMGRQLFLHHYLPAYYFLIMAFAHLLDLIVSHILSKKKIIGVSLCVAILSSSYYFYETHKNMAYGTPQLKETCVKNRWFSGWDYNCDGLLESWEAYDNYTMASFEPKQTSFLATNLNEIYKKDSNGNDILDKDSIIEQDQRLSQGKGQPKVYQEDPVEVNADEIRKNQGPKKFIGPDGKEIDEELALKLIAEQGGKVMKQEQKMPGTGLPENQHLKPSNTVNVDVNDIMKEEGLKKFVDQHGNQLDENVAMSLLKNGGQIVGVEKESIVN